MSAWRRRADRPGVQLGALALLLAAIAIGVFHLTRGSSFLFDDWSFILDRRGGSLATYLDPHNQHFSLVPVAIYKLLFATFGIGSYVPYRVTLIVCNSVLYTLVFLYARSRVGGWAALVLTALLALLGPGWEDFLWPFQIGFVLSLVGGVGALLALERDTRGGDVLAGALTMVALASSGVGIPVAAGVVVAVGIEIARKRRPLRDVAIVAIPLVLFAAWWLAYQTGTSGVGGFSQAPSFVEKEAASVIASLFGRAGPVGLDGPGTLTSWGTPLLIAMVVLVIVRVVRGGPVSPRVIPPAVMVLAFWLATAVARTGFFANPYASRYIYVSATFILLAACDLAAGWKPHPVVIAALAVVAGIAIGSNIGELRTAAELVRGFGQATTADLAMLEIGRPLEPPGYVAHALPGYPLIQLPARQFFTIAATLGDPAASLPTIAGDSVGVQQNADRELIAIHHLSPSRVSRRLATGPGCVRLAPDRPMDFPLTSSQRRLLIRAEATPVKLSVRRLAALVQPIGVVAAGAAAQLTIAPDLSTIPWHVQLTSAGSATACGRSSS